MGTFEKKFVYHSDLVKVAESGLMVRFVGKLTEGKFGKLMDFEVHGDNDKYAYQAENGDIETYLTHIPPSTWVKLFASGSRNTAIISAEDRDGNPILPDGNPQPSTTDSGQPPANEWPGDDPALEERRTGGTDAREKLTEAFLHYAKVVKGEFGVSDGAIEAAQKLAVTEFIQK